MWSSAAVAHLLQGSTCCALRDGILHILVVTSVYLSYCCLSIISNQSAHSPLTSDINKAFSPTRLPLTGYFLFFGPSQGRCWPNGWPKQDCIVVPHLPNIMEVKNTVYYRGQHKTLIKYKSK